MLAGMKTPEIASSPLIPLAEVVEVRQPRAPRRNKHEADWLPGETISCEPWYGRSRYVVHLYDGRRVVAFDEDVRAIGVGFLGEALREAS